MPRNTRPREAESDRRLVINLDALSLPENSAISPEHFRRSVESELSRLLRAGGAAPRMAGTGGSMAAGEGLAYRVARAIHEQVKRAG